MKGDDEGSIGTLDAGKVIRHAVDICLWKPIKRILLYSGNASEPPKSRETATAFTKFVLNLLSNSIKYTPAGGK